MPPIYPDKALGEKVGAEQMKNQAYAYCKAKYEEVYQTPLVYTCDEGQAFEEKSTVIKVLETQEEGQEILQRQHA